MLFTGKNKKGAFCAKNYLSRHGGHGCPWCREEWERKAPNEEESWFGALWCMYGVYVYGLFASPPLHADGEEEDDEGGEEAAEEEPEAIAVDVEDGREGDDEYLDRGNGEIGDGVVVHGFAGLLGVDNAEKGDAHGHAAGPPAPGEDGALKPIAVGEFLAEVKGDEPHDDGADDDEGEEGQGVLDDDA